MDLLTQVMVTVVLVGLAMVTSGQGPEAFLANDGTLKMPIRLTEQQGGIAGNRVTVYAIEADGSYTYRSYTQYINNQGDEEKRGETSRRGRLSKEKLGAIAKELSAQKFTELPDKLGREAKVNPRSLAIDVGDKRITLMVGPGDDPNNPAAGDPQAAARGRFMAVARAIREPVDAERK